AFLAALLNSQPMGFYTPSQLVQDASRHGVQVLPADVQRSEWDSTLEKLESDPNKRSAVRLGLGRVDGLARGVGERIVAARSVRLFAGVDDLARRARLVRRDLEQLAAADALASLSGHR